MKKLFTSAAFACCLMTLLNVHGQKKITTNPMITDDFKIQEFYMTSPSSFIMWGPEQRKGEREIRNGENFKVTATGKIAFRFEEKDMDILHKKVLDGNLYLFFHVSDDEKRTYYMTKMDKKSFDIESSAVKLFSIAVTKRMPYFDLKLAFSPNQKLIMMSIPEYNSNGTEEIGWQTRVYDLDLKMKREHELPEETYKVPGTKVGYFGITNDEIMLWVVNVYETIKVKKNTETKFKRVNLIVLNKGKVTSSGNRIFEDGVISDIYRVHQSENKLYLTGNALFSPKNGTKGFFTLVYDLVKCNELLFKTVKIPAQIIASENAQKQLSNLKSKEKDEDALHDYQIYKLFVDKAGNQYGVFEKWVVKILKAPQNSGRSDRYFYYTYNTLVFKLDANGNMVYMTVIPKELNCEWSSDYIDNFSSMQDDFLYFLIKDNGKNYDKNGKFYSPKGKVRPLAVSSLYALPPVVAVVKFDLNSGKYERYLSQFKPEQIYRTPNSINKDPNSNSYFYNYIHDKKGYILNMEF